MPGAGISPMSYPFPVVANGAREFSAIRNSLGATITAGKRSTCVPFERPHARQNRLQLDLRRMFDDAAILSLGYAGSLFGSLAAELKPVAWFNAPK